MLEERLLINQIETAQQKLASMPERREQADYLLLEAMVYLAQGNYSEAESKLKAAQAVGEAQAAFWLLALKYFSHLPPMQLFQQVSIESLRYSSYQDYPREIHIETYSLCNARCGFCPYPGLERKGQQMSEALWQKIIGQLADFPTQLPIFICLFKVNDPFLDPRLARFCQQLQVQVPQARLRLFSNGSTLRTQDLEWLSQLHNLETFWISLNHYEAVSYQELMGLPLQATLKKLKQLHTFVAQHSFPCPVTLSRVADGSSQDQAFLDFVAEQFPHFFGKLLKRSNWLGQVDLDSPFEVPRTACSRWFELSIMSTGQVSLCCMDGTGAHRLGDLNQQSLLEIYHQPAYKRLRAQARDRQMAGGICASCNL